MSIASCHHIALLPGSPQSSRISRLRATLPALSKAITEWPWSPIVAIAGSIATPQATVASASTSSGRDPAKRSNGDRGAARSIAAIVCSESAPRP